MRRRAAFGGVAVLVALGVLVAGCARPGDDPTVTRVRVLLADVEGDDASAAKAVDALAALGPADAVAVPVLMHALSCPAEPTAAVASPAHDHHHDSGDHADHVHGACNDHVVIAAASGLGAIGGAAVAPVLSQLRAGNEPDRTFAGYALARMSPAAAPALIAALDDPAPRVRLAIVGAIRNMQPPPADALAAIAGRLADHDTEVRVQAADTLGHFGVAAVPALLMALEDGELRVRASAASALRLIGPPAREAAPALRVHLADPAPPVRLNAAAALAALAADDPATVTALAAALADPDHTVRWGAAMALGRLGPAAAAARPALERARSDQEKRVQAAASDALARITDRNATP